MRWGGWDRAPGTSNDRASLAHRSPPPSLPAALSACTDGAVTWTLGAASLVEAIRGADGDSEPASATVASPPFAIPPASLLLPLEGVLGSQHWQLVCDAGAAGLSAFLRWAGGPAPAGTGGHSVCCEFRLAVRCLRQPAADGAGGAGGDGGGEAMTTGPSWLAHAFNADAPAAGKRCCLQSMATRGLVCAAPPTCASLSTARRRLPPMHATAAPCLPPLMQA